MVLKIYLSVIFTGTEFNNNKGYYYPLWYANQKMKVQI